MQKNRKKNYFFALIGEYCGLITLFRGASLCAYVIYAPFEQSSLETPFF